MKNVIQIVCVVVVMGLCSVASAVVSDFEQGHLDGWTVGLEGVLSHASSGGNPGGYAQMDDFGGGLGNLVYAPPKFLGDWSGLVGETLSLDAKQILGFPIFPDTVDFEISGPGGSATSDTGEYMSYSWTPYSTTIMPSAWVVTAGTWEDLLANVTMLRIDAEYVQGDDTFGFDNVELTSDSATPPVAEADGLYSVWVGDPLILNASSSTDAEGNIVSYMWDLDDDGIFETDAGDQPFFVVDYEDVQNLGLAVGGMYDIHLQVTDNIGLTDTDSSSLRVTPEPATLSLLTLGGLAMIRRRRRR